MTRSSSSRSVVRGGLSIAAAMGIMNVATYAFTMLAARLLGPAEYSGLAALLGVLIVANVVSLGLQATAARRIAADPGNARAIEDAVVRAGRRAALTLGLATAAASPLIAHVLHLSSWLPALLAAVAIASFTLMGPYAGVLQGEGRWNGLTAVYLGMGLGRLLLGGIGAWLTRTMTGTFCGIAIGALVPTLIGLWLLQRRRVSDPAGRTHSQSAPPATAADAQSPASGLLREALHSSHVLFAFYALTTADVLVARAMLPEHEAGLYAAGLILVKAVLFLPQFVVVVAFPALSKSDAKRNLHLVGLAIVLGIGLVTMAGVWLLPRLALSFVGGAAYAEIAPQLWMFAAVGGMLAGIQLLVYNSIARRHARAVWFVWAALAGIVIGALLVETRTGLLNVVLCADFALLVILAVITRNDPPEPVGDPANDPDQATPAL